MSARQKLFFALMIFLAGLLGNAWGQSAKPTNSGRFGQVHGARPRAFTL